MCGPRCDAFCRLVFEVCVPANHGASNPYPSMDSCLTACRSFAFDNQAPEFDPAKRDTLNCRQFRLQLAFFDAPGGSAFVECPNLAAMSGACR